MVRYKWDCQGAKYLYQTLEMKPEGRVELEKDYRNPIFVNILEHIADEKTGWTYYLVRLFYASGKVVEGWTTDHLFSIELTNTDELFDGRFNA